MPELHFTTEELATEEWRPMLGHENLYHVSNVGRVRRNKTQRILCVGLDRGGYYRYALFVEGRTVHRYAHRLVAGAFIGPPPDGYTVNHKDGDVSNNCIANLEYLTTDENLRHAREVLKVRPGFFKLTAPQVRQIRAMCASQTQAEVARRFQLSPNMVSDIALRRKWKYLSD